MLHHVHHAVTHVRELRARVLEHQIFHGYSSRARAFGGCAALAGALLMSSSSYPPTIPAHIAGWGFVCALALIANYGDVLLWYTAQPSERRELARLRPVMDGVPPIVVGGILTLALILRGDTSMLFGVWMCLFGLTHLSSRHSMPAAIWWLGWYYIGCGAAYLLSAADQDFLRPLPMGGVFFCGELAGAAILYHHHRRRSAVSAGQK